MDRSQLEKLIIKDEIKTFFKELDPHIKPGTKLRDEFISLQSRHEKYLSDKNLNVVSLEDLNVEKSALTEAFLSLIDRADSSSEDDNKTKKKRSKVQLFALVGFLASVVSIIAFFKDLFPASAEAESTFTLTIYAHGSESRHDCVVAKEKIILFLEGNTVPGELDSNCRAIFNGIPEKFKKKEIPVSISLKAQGFELENPDSSYVIKDKAIYVPIKRDDSLGWVKGKVWKEDQSGFIKDALVEIVDIGTTRTDSLGNFFLFVEEEKQRVEYDIIIMKDGYILNSNRLLPKSGVNEYMLSIAQ